MMITQNIDFSKGLTDEQLKMLEEVETAPVVIDDDAPDISDEQLIKFAQLARQQRQKKSVKQTVALKLSPQALQKARSLGKGYTSVLSRILESALADNEIIRQYL